MDKKKQIGRVIAQALLQGKSVRLDGIGQLSPKRLPAFRESLPSGFKWHPPQLGLGFDPDSKR
ncbi:MAG: hypothetical protein O3B41_02550 [Bacteroidetes bacterium]|nr:hypothetical protein [Bacteroidota bacterium]